MRTCSHGQYDGWLFEDDLSYHADFADATFSTMFLDMDMDDWLDTALEITTGKLMGTTYYSVSEKWRYAPFTICSEFFITCLNSFPSCGEAP